MCYCFSVVVVGGVVVVVVLVAAVIVVIIMSCSLQRINRLPDCVFETAADILVAILSPWLFNRHGSVIRKLLHYSLYSFNAEKFNSFYSKINEWAQCVFCWISWSVGGSFLSLFAALFLPLTVPVRL